MSKSVQHGWNSNIVVITSSDYRCYASTKWLRGIMNAPLDYYQSLILDARKKKTVVKCQKSLIRVSLLLKVRLRVGSLCLSRSFYLVFSCRYSRNFSEKARSNKAKNMRNASFRINFADFALA